MKPEVSVTITQTLLRAMEAANIEGIDSLLSEFDLTPEFLSNPENRVSFEIQSAIWQHAFSQRGPEFAITFAETTQIASFHLIGYIAINSQTIDDALAAAEQFQMAAGQGGTLSRENHSTGIAICYRPINPEQVTTAERCLAMLAANIQLGRSLIGADYRPTRVNLTLAEPESADTIERFFQCPVHYSQPQDQMVLDQKLLQQPLPHASVELLNVMKLRAEKVLAGLDSDNTMAGRVAQLISASLLGQEPDKNTIAGQLHISPRTLQRKLANEQTTYQQVLDNTRHQLALDYLSQPELNITDIAYLLGFTEPSAFYRAFKKWQGVTPGNYRDQL
ncbi:MAG: AraC family transcriptional regulator [Candidatus Pelagadaptatus aseana]|uniref:AraC family transcriptional regulator n=1 Tax=Candidatus Pelagadaptatus aseana TaxID=3120508 RepID=UPI0039B1761E